MNTPKSNPIKELLLFFIINILYIDSTIFMIVLLFLTLKLDLLSDSFFISHNVINNIVCYFGIFHVVMKFTTLILYYKIEYQNLSNPLILNLFKKMRTESKFKFWFLFISTIPYQILLIVNIISTRSIVDFLETILIFLCLSVVFPYILLFIFWVYEDIHDK